MPILNRRKIDTNIEKRIVTGMIVSKKYLQEVYPFVDLAYFQNSYTQKVASWCLDYYSYYEGAPFETIQDIFNHEKSTLSEEESELIKFLLTDISKKYQLNEGINVPYLVDKTEEFCKIRELEITAGNIQVLLSRGDLKSAEEQIGSFRKVQKLTSNWVNPFDPDEIYNTFADKDVDFFRFPGILGDFVGDLERGWLVGVSGAFKAGKTWFAQEFGVIGLLSGLRVAFFSLEMNERAMKERLYKRFTAAGNISTSDESPLDEGEYIYPAFDCIKNQDGSCELRRRTQEATLINADGSLPDFDKENPYRICTACRELKNKNHPNREPDSWKEHEGDKGRFEYHATTWFEILKRPEFSAQEAEQTMKGFRKQYGNLYRIKSYPRMSANIGDVKRDLDLLEQIDGFVPDIVIVDYADILKSEDGALLGVEKEDRSWIALSQLAGERHVLTIAPTQVTKSALDAKLIKSDHMARWVGKLGHVDVMLTVNQKDTEKPYGIVRIGMLAHRHQDCKPGATVTILQQINLGQVHLDSERVFEREE